MEVLKKYWQEIVAIYEKLDKRKRIYILAGAISSVFFIVLLVQLSTRINYEILFSELDPTEAGVIVEKLKEQKVAFKLKNGGSTILVPDKSVDELRLELASQGFPQSGTVGYEIFDKNNIGTTDFIQKINFRRALEGELSRTISTFSEIVSVRVHLVIPEPSLFIEDKKETTASITIKLKPGKTLKPRQIIGVSNLVASSVEGLKADNVTIVDSHGNILSQPSSKNSSFALSSSQIELKRNVENYYSGKLKKLLENVVGKDKVAVQVAAELNFDRVDRTVTRLNPDDQVVISEQKNIRTSDNTNGGSPQKTEDVTTNYEFTRTVERVIQDVGNIKRISVAVMVDGKYQTPAGAGKNGKPEYVPLSDDELTNLRDIVKSAMGFSALRGDEIKMVNMPFDTTERDKITTELTNFEQKLFWEKTVKKAIYLLLFLAVLFVLWRIYKSYKMVFMPIPTEQELALEGGNENYEEGLLLEKNEQVRLQQKVASLSKKNPPDAAKLIKAWLTEDLEKDSEIG